jgi:hypothetical protein
MSQIFTVLKKLFMIHLLVVWQSYFQQDFFFYISSIIYVSRNEEQMCTHVKVFHPPVNLHVTCATCLPCAYITTGHGIYTIQRTSC